MRIQYLNTLGGLEQHPAIVANLEEAIRRVDVDRSRRDQGRHRRLGADGDGPPHSERVDRRP